MRKLPTIATYFCLFIVVATLAGGTFGATVHPADMPRRTWERALADFDNRWREYQESPLSPQAVLIAPSYGAFGRVKGVRNLSVTSMRPAELDKILRQCRRQDTIFVPITILDPVSVNRRPRSDLHSPLLRRLSIARTALIPGAATPFRRNRRGMTDCDRADLRKIYSPSMRLDAVGDQLIWFSSDDRSPVDMDRYQKLRKRHPNIVFLFFPTYSLSADTDDCDMAARTERFFPTDALSADIEDCDMAARAERFCAANAHFRSLWGDIPHIDLSDALSQKHFTDLFHYTDEGKAIIRGRLRGIVADSRADSTLADLPPARP